MMESKIPQWIPAVTAAIITCGAATDRFIKTGMSIAMIVFALFFFYSLYKKEYVRDFHLDKNVWYALLSVYGLLVFTTLFHLDNMQNVIGGEISTLGILSFTIPFWLILYVGWRWDISKGVILAFTLFGFAICLFGLYEYQVKHLTRLVTFYNFPTRAGCVLESFIPFTVALFWYFRKQKWLRMVYVLLLVLELYCLLLTETRASFLSIAGASVVLVIAVCYHGRQWISMKKRLALGAVVLLFMGAAIGYSISLANGNTYRMQGEERPMIYASTWQMWQDHKLLGIGSSEWQAAYAGPYRPQGSKEAGQLIHPHNMFLYFLSTSGVIGALGYVLYTVFLFRYCWKRIGKTPTDPFAWAIFAAFLCFTAHGLLDATIVSKQVARIFYLLLGVSMVFAHWHLRSAEDTPRLDTEIRKEKSL